MLRVMVILVIKLFRLYLSNINLSMTWVLIKNHIHDFMRRNKILMQFMNLSFLALVDQHKRKQGMCFLEICHLIACVYDRVRVDLKRYNFSETFFPLRTTPHKNPNDCIMCIGWLSKSRHFVQIYLKPRWPIPLTSYEWTTHSTAKVETWPNHFVERMQEFERLSNIERELNVQNSKGVPPINLTDDKSLDSF